MPVLHISGEKGQSAGRLTLRQKMWPYSSASRTPL
jgi:hypothetical protein